MSCMWINGGLRAQNRKEAAAVSRTESGQSWTKSFEDNGWLCQQVYPRTEVICESICNSEGWYLKHHQLSDVLIGSTVWCLLQGCGPVVSTFLFWILLWYLVNLAWRFCRQILFTWHALTLIILWFWSGGGLNCKSNSIVYVWTSLTIKSVVVQFPHLFALLYIILRNFNLQLTFGLRMENQILHTAGIHCVDHHSSLIDYMRIGSDALAIFSILPW